MKKAIIALFVFTATFSACQKISAQSRDKILLTKQTYDNDLLKQLKATTTVFFYKNGNTLANDSLRQAITSGWDLTPIIFDDINNFEKYGGNPQFSYFIIEGISKTHHSSTGSYYNTHYYLALRLFKDVTKKGKVETNGLCRIELYPNFQTLGLAATRGNADEIIDKLYQKGGFFNWTPILLKAQLAAVSTNLKNLTRPDLFAYVKADNLTQLLARDTLYVPQSLLMSFNAFTGKESNKKEGVFSEYHYKYRICTDSELYQIFEKEKRGRLLFEYVKSSTDKFITIYDLKERKVVYRKYTPVSYNLKDKDISAIE